MWWGEWVRVGSRRGRPVLREAVTEGAFVRAKTGEAEAAVPQSPGRGGWGAIGPASWWGGQYSARTCHPEPPGRSREAAGGSDISGWASVTLSTRHGFL